MDPYLADMKPSPPPPDGTILTVGTDTVTVAWSAPDDATRLAEFERRLLRLILAGYRSLEVVLPNGCVIDGPMRERMVRIDRYCTLAGATVAIHHHSSAIGNEAGTCQ